MSRATDSDPSDAPAASEAVPAPPAPGSPERASGSPEPAGTSDNPAGPPESTAGEAPPGSGADRDDPPPTPRPRTRRGRWVFAVVAVLALAADILSKLAVVSKLEDTDHPPITVVPNVLYFVHTRNTGAAFSLGESYTYVLTAVAIGVIVVILRYARRLASTGWAIALGLVLGGACGNVIDRLFREGGGVVDFLAIVDPYDPPWPIFNLADSALCVGVAILVFLELTGRRIDGSRVRKSDSAKLKDD
ncbi:signal peptidase II [Cryptosporangium phraense]|uniref:Lipoprotein signal peptidase n=1 Tax=Cryptosporangium phraense TaxID=2593070 RepID=A0A545AKA3_9ACTN|nr:signal peptidase II [Cryptosporangium phraense]